MFWERWHEQKVDCSKILGEKLFFKVSSPSTFTFGCKKHFWLLVIEDNTDNSWTYFSKEKLKLKNMLLVLIKDLKTKYGIQVKNACCDSAGENDDSEKACIQEGMGIKFEYTVSDTQHQNGHTG